MRLAALLCALAPALALGGETLLTEAAAPKALFPDSTSAARSVLTLTDAELSQLSKALGKRVEQRTYVSFEVKAGDTLLGWVLVLEALGQTSPITFAVGVTRELAVRDVQVMVYREPRGGEIVEPRFRAQFTGKRTTDAVELGRDVDAITGATISSRAAAYAVKKALALMSIVAARR